MLDNCLAPHLFIGKSGAKSKAGAEGGGAGRGLADPKIYTRNLNFG